MGTGSAQRLCRARWRSHPYQPLGQQHHCRQGRNPPAALRNPIGAVLGCVLAMGLSLLFAAEVPGVEALDPIAYAGGMGVVLLAALSAAFFPSKRAASIEPSSTLRMD